MDAKNIFTDSMNVGDRIRRVYSLYRDGEISDKQVFSLLEEIQAFQIDNIVNAKSEYPTDGTVYYLSNNGDDSNDGKSPESAWATLNKLKEPDVVAKIKRGDTILFERGGLFRGTVICPPGVTYSAYGEGEKPIVTASLRNYADPELWEETDVRDIYRLKLQLGNVGVVMFNDTRRLGNYHELIAAMKPIGRDGCTGYYDLDRDLQFLNDFTDGYLYLRCEGGNPGERFHNIEIGGHDIIFFLNDDVVVDNIRVRQTGRHAITQDGVKNTTVRNCVCDYIGGCICRGHFGKDIFGYGNAIQVYDYCDGWYVYDNWVYQIFDTGITHQYAGSNDCFMENVRYTGNVCVLCHWPIEWYNYDRPGKKSSFNNTYIADNICSLTGYGWGSLHRKKIAAILESWDNTMCTENFVIENNVFDRSAGKMYDLCGKGNSLNVMRDNICIQNKDGIIGNFYDNCTVVDIDGELINTDENTYMVSDGAQRVLREVANDKTSVFLINDDTTVKDYTPELK